MRFGGEGEVRVGRGRKREEQKRHFRVENKASRALCVILFFFLRVKNKNFGGRNINLKIVWRAIFSSDICLNLFYR